MLVFRATTIVRTTWSWCWCSEQPRLYVQHVSTSQMRVIYKQTEHTHRNRQSTNPHTDRTQREHKHTQRHTQTHTKRIQRTENPFPARILRATARIILSTASCTSSSCSYSYSHDYTWVITPWQLHNNDYNHADEHTWLHIHEYTSMNTHTWIHINDYTHIHDYTLMIAHWWLHTDNYSHVDKHIWDRTLNVIKVLNIIELSLEAIYHTILYVIYIHIYIYIYILVYMYIYMYVCTYICMYVHLCSSKPFLITILIAANQGMTLCCAFWLFLLGMVVASGDFATNSNLLIDLLVKSQFCTKILLCLPRLPRSNWTIKNNNKSNNNNDDNNNNNNINSNNNNNNSNTARANQMQYFECHAMIDDKRIVNIKFNTNFMAIIINIPYHHNKHHNYYC